MNEIDNYMKKMLENALNISNVKPYKRPKKDYQVLVDLIKFKKYFF
jgi:hypothetical protein